ncbi:MAG: hypothetical protein RAO92_03430 [Candidatus Euphemobacter frigidus]|nr:hypothetical protein [Candidatus Euphemobacter frigidus]
MESFLSDYPHISDFLSSIAQYKDTFIFDKLYNPAYGFWPHLEYFLLNQSRYGNHESIIDRLSLLVPITMNVGTAWAKWRKFRSAQSEITSIYIIENYLSGRVIEIVPVNKIPTPDLLVGLNNSKYFIEVKAQSGQQHGSEHPRSKEPYLYSPQDENDLKSWLFEEAISSRNGKPMKPKTIEADEKQADILIAMIDIHNTIDNVKDQALYICPNSSFIEKNSIKINSEKIISVHFFKSDYPMKRSIKNLKEIWLFNESHLDKFIVLSKEAVLLNHMKNKR